MDRELLTFALEGHLILTVNERLSRHLLDQFDQYQMDRGACAWQRPNINSLSAWLNECLNILPESPIILNQAQLLHVWEKIIAQDSSLFGETLLQIVPTARRAHQAHQLLVTYATEFNSAFAAEDQRAFLRWQKSWLELSRQKSWRDPAEIPWIVSKAIEHGPLKLPESVMWAGFDVMTPALGALTHALQEKNVSIKQWAPSVPNSKRIKVQADDLYDEVRICAQWVRHELAQRPLSSIGIVVPQFEKYKKYIDSVFMAELAPEGLIEGEVDSNIFNLSLAHKLDQFNVVHAALRFLAMPAQLGLEDISWLLTTPYAARSIKEHNERARVDLELRQLRQDKWSLEKLISVIGQINGKRSYQLSGFLELLSCLQSHQRETKPKLPGGWAEYFFRLLSELGWPGERSVSSVEYQAVEHFHTALAQLSSLDTVSEPMSRPDAVQVLTRLVRSLEFQPEGSNAQVQVLGELESGGLTFDALWILGLDENSYPRTPAPNPFIPLSLQREKKMLRADAERELQFAQLVLQRLFASAPDIVLSYPLSEGDAELRPSPLIKSIPIQEVLLAPSASPDTTIWNCRPKMESLIDETGLPLHSLKPFTGGTGIVKDQALCPFRAYARHRLKASFLEPLDIGIDGLSRGKLAHTALEIFWKQVDSQSVLISMGEQERSETIASAVSSALERLEKEYRCNIPSMQRRVEFVRLKQMVMNWLDFEAERAPFKVYELEKLHFIEVGSLKIRIRIDRLDQLEDGSFVVIDYKTGRVDPLEWLEDRITEPQLPLYSLCLNRDEISAVMFAELQNKAGQSAMRGLARSYDIWPGSKPRRLEDYFQSKNWAEFADVLEHWNRVLIQTGHDFSKGFAAVDPVSRERACQYCELTGLCRIMEESSVGGGYLDGSK